MHLQPPDPPRGELYILMGPPHGADPDSIDSHINLAESEFQQPPELTTHHYHFLSDDDAISLDTRRLQTQHTTEGYRDGIAVGKAESIQAGFDEGFSVGAHVGLKAGRILGLLEGVAGALKESGHHSSTRIEQLLSDAKSDLNTDSIFSEQYWTPDGSWRYRVKGSEDNSKVSFEDLALKHPVIMKWNKTIEWEIKRWFLDETLPVLASGAPQTQVENSVDTTQATSRQVVDW
ncbi:hypothetical protein F5Y06DRAFT_62744 [Hypoxylon sp. FL0890]|nr:hypothetical protein F5Y06DRAFT_62744 [Hypoxylon sp. FL0890]